MTRKNDHIKVGKEGEKLAADYLLGKGFEVIEKNYRYRRFEIDIIAKKESTIVFVEVKTRSGNYFGEPEETVAEKQAAQIIEAAENYIFENDWNGEIRFDIISILKRKENKITHFEDAFY